MKIRKKPELAEALASIQERRKRGEATAENAKNFGAKSEQQTIDVSRGQFLKEAADAEAIKEERRAKIEAIKAAVQNGSYNIDSREIATALVRDIETEIALARSSEN